MIAGQMGSTDGRIGGQTVRRMGGGVRKLLSGRGFDYRHVCAWGRGACGWLEVAVVGGKERSVQGGARRGAAKGLRYRRYPCIGGPMCRPGLEAVERGGSDRELVLLWVGPGVWVGGVWVYWRVLGGVARVVGRAGGVGSERSWWGWRSLGGRTSAGKPRAGGDGKVRRELGLGTRAIWQGELCGRGRRL